MAKGHGIIVNLSSNAPFIFQFNPETINTNKKITYAVAPNIGGAFKKKYFAGFDSKEIEFSIQCIDMNGPTGVMDDIAYFEQLREPDPGFGVANSFFGNENYPPPRVLLQFGISFIPLVWEVLNIQIEETHFHSGHIRGVVGVPKRCHVDIKLSLVEDHALNKANQIAKKAQMFSASAKSIANEILYKNNNRRRENTGLFGYTNGEKGVLSFLKIDPKY